jgi:hypothetical protein
MRPKRQLRTPKFRSLTYAIGCILYLWVSLTEAAPAVELPSGCGTEAEFTEALHVRLGDEAEAALNVTELQIFADNDGYVLQMRVGDSHRNLRDKNCNDLFRASIVVAAALFKSNEATVFVPQAAEKLDPSPLPTKLDGSRALASSAPHAERVIAPYKPHQGKASDWTFGLQSRFGIAAGLLPQMVPTAGIRGALGRELIGASATVTALGPSSTQDSRGIGASTWALGTALGAYFLPVSRVTIEGGLRGDRVTGVGIGTDENRAAVVWALGPYMGVAARPLVRGPFALDLGVEAQWLLLRPKFEVIDYKAVFRSAPVTATGYLAIGYRFR